MDGEIESGVEEQPQGQPAEDTGDGREGQMGPVMFEVRRGTPGRLGAVFCIGASRTLEEVNSLKP